MRNILQLSAFLLLCLCSPACNNTEENLCELGPALPILCISVFDPVCGCNEITYGNECLATVAGVHSFTPGECL